MRVVTLIENLQDDAKELAHEHGLSLYIKTTDKVLLFDAGKTGAIIGNALKLGIDIKKINAVILSHAHYDHSGGLLAFFNENDKAVVYMKRDAAQEFFSTCCGLRKNIGADRRLFSEHAERILYIDRLTEIFPNIFLVSNITGKHVLPKGNKYLFVKSGKQLVRDSFRHELILVIKEAGYLSVFTGCAHNGIANILQTVCDTFDGAKIKSVFGGFHLMRSSVLNFLRPSALEVDAVLKSLEAYDIKKIYTGHCTGEAAFRQLKAALGEKIQYLKTGTIIS